MSRASDRWPKTNVFRCSICDTECSNIIVDSSNEWPGHIGVFIDQREGGESSVTYLNKANAESLIKLLGDLVARMM